MLTHRITDLHQTAADRLTDLAAYVKQKLRKPTPGYHFTIKSDLRTLTLTLYANDEPTGCYLTLTRVSSGPERERLALMLCARCIGPMPDTLHRARGVAQLLEIATDLHERTHDKTYPLLP